MTPKRNVFLDEHFADPTIKKSKNSYPTSNINLKINTLQPWPKTLQKDTTSVTRV
jgi:hypothetical protein